ncbi:hypothetical protein [Acidisoma silvae]|uniref:Uncharacterized protein n=1 Tax=Acidisoma silvae TaxID=2802396 RepID=A0A963YQ03_9PROT|nr:hypothetical protein [Acidisoma silvae]MCB8874762.1 hypothetical protein [Acidisoma silvae]
MAFTDAEKTDLRRFCGYPAYGTGASGFQGWRFFQAYGLMEFRLNNLSGAEETVCRTYLGTLRGLEAAVPHTGQSLDTDQAAVWTRNKDELRDRLTLLDEWRRRLCSFLGLPPGPALTDPGMTLVV